ncbi:MAG: hydroxymethylbilane synthase [Halodesulfurarchaeum sp.]
MSTRETIQVATRGSDLALRQTSMVQSWLAEHRIEAELVEVETRGDRIDDALIRDLGKTGAFVRALDEKVLSGEVDAAVHSMKDVPTEQPEELVVAAVPARAAPEDVLLTPEGTTLEDLPEGAVVGTSSLRRGAQVLARRPDLEIEPLRGNVDTRVEKVLAPHLQAEHEARLGESADESDDDTDEYEKSAEEWFDGLAEIERAALGREVDTEYDAIVLAKAGLERSGLEEDVEFSLLPTDRHVPSAGQGALAISAHEESEVGESIRRALDHEPTRVATTVERIVLAELGAGCVAPLGVHATVTGDIVRATAQVLSQDGTEEIRERRDLDVEDYANEARALAADMADRGAASLIEEAKRE